MRTYSPPVQYGQKKQVGAALSAAVDKISIFKVLKIGALIGLVILLLTQGKKIYNAITHFTGSILGSDNTKTNAEDAKDGIIGNQYQSTILGSAVNTVTGNTTGFSGATTTKQTAKKYPWRPIVDAIFEKLNGTNIMMYPEVVNRLAHLPDDQAKKAVYYWNSTYRSGLGSKYSLANFIGSEANSGGINDPFINLMSSKHYAPALGKLKKVGMGETKIS